jgi:ABC-type amino acid transport substrate-binding protein
MGRWLRSSLVALAVLTLIVSGCGGKSTPVTVSVGTPPKGGALTFSLDAVAKLGTLKIHLACEISQFGPGVARRITEIVWGGKVRPWFASVSTRSEALTLLKSGEADIVLDTCLPNDEDLGSLHASPPVYVDSLRVMVSGDGGIKQIEELDGKRVAYVKDQFAQAPRYFSDKYPKLHIEFEDVFSYGNPPLGGAVAVVGPTSELAYTLTSWVGPSYHLRLLPERLGTWNYSVYVRKQNTELANAVDKAIHQMIESGELAQLVKKWGRDI